MCVVLVQIWKINKYVFYRNYCIYFLINIAFIHSSAMTFGILPVGQTTIHTQSSCVLLQYHVVPHLFNHKVKQSRYRP
jgi:hypothetical protein